MEKEGNYGNIFIDTAQPKICLVFNQKLLKQEIIDTARVSIDKLKRGISRNR